MGGSASIPLSEGDSFISPGSPSIISEPIQFEYAAFLNEIVAFLRYPIPSTHEAVLKECKVEEGSSPDEFTVTVTLDPVKLKQYGFENKEKPELERIFAYNKVKINRAERTVETENYKERWAGEEPELTVKTMCHFTKEGPLQLDYYWTMPDGTRKADSTVCAVLQPIINQVASDLSDRKVVLKVDEDKKCYATGTIDEGVATYEKFFDAVIAVTKDGTAAAQGTVEDISEAKFKIIPAAESMPYTVVSLDKEKGTILYDLMSTDGTKKVSSTCYTFTKTPLSLEITIAGEDGGKIAGQGTQRILQRLMDGAVYKCSGGSWFGGLLG